MTFLNFDSPKIPLGHTCGGIGQNVLGSKISRSIDIMCRMCLNNIMMFYFRHTGELEVFHHHMLMYAAKLFAFR